MLPLALKGQTGKAVCSWWVLWYRPFGMAFALIRTNRHGQGCGATEKTRTVYNDMNESVRKFGKQEVGEVTEPAFKRRTPRLNPTSERITHEVGNLLNNVGLTLCTLKRERLSPRGERAVTVLEKESKRVKRFIRNLLSLTEHGEPNFSTQSMHGIIQDIVFIHESDAAQRGIRLKMFWSDDLPPVHIDAQLMYHALINLVKNSLEAMNRPGDIVIKGNHKENSLVVVVEDTGPGMEPDVVNQIFNPFFTTKGRAGTGLGLSIVEAILKAHHGTVECQSEPGKGARFILRLPRYREGSPTGL
jgi:signal transduction histidine kinase